MSGYGERDAQRASRTRSAGVLRIRRERKCRASETRLGEVHRLLSHRLSFASRWTFAVQLMQSSRAKWRPLTPRVVRFSSANFSAYSRDSIIGAEGFNISPPVSRLRNHGEMRSLRKADERSRGARIRIALNSLRSPEQNQPNFLFNSSSTYFPRVHRGLK